MTITRIEYNNFDGKHYWKIVTRNQKLVRSTKISSDEYRRATLIDQR